MNGFDQRFIEVQRTTETMAQFAIVIWILGFLVAMAVAVWIFGDAESRGKSGIAAALLALLSVFYGIALTLIVVCTWILFRPEKGRRHSSGSGGNLPNDLPSGVVASPSPSEFLNELGESAKSSESTTGNEGV